jgi:hypothetical protein
MPISKCSVNWKRPLRQTKAVPGYQLEIIQVPSAAGPKRLAADDCPSGDWAGALVCNAGRLRVVLADVEDKGHAARPYHDTLARHLPVRETFNSWLTALDARWPMGRFASVGFMEIDTLRHEFRVQLAGHPDPILRMPRGAARVRPECRLGLVGLNLGVAETEPVARPFPLGACLIMVSDGVLDAGVVVRQDAFGMDRLLSVVNSTSTASQMASRILKSVSEHVDGVEPEDDVTIVVVSRSDLSASVERIHERLAA